jgi:deoxyribose-phosphate aldolase
MNLAPYIDHTVLKPNTSLADVQQVCSEAITYGFAAVCVPPYFLKDAVSLVENSEVKSATVVGFPYGYSHYSAKAAEVKQAIKDKANEVDVVLNITAFKEKNFSYLLTEFAEPASITKDNNVT